MGAHVPPSHATLEPVVNSSAEMEKAKLSGDKCAKSDDNADIQEAIDHYSRALDLKPAKLSAAEKLLVAKIHSNRGKVYLKSGNKIKAMQDAQASIAADPNFYGGHSLVGSASLALQNLAAAKQAYEQALKLDVPVGSRKTITDNLKTVTNGMQKQADAVPEMNRTAELENKILSKKGKANIRMGKTNFKEAAKLYTECIQLASTATKEFENEGANLHILHSNRSIAYQQLKQWDKALADADKCIELKPRWFKGHSHKGGILKEKERYGEAREEYLEAIRSNPGASRKKLETHIDFLDNKLGITDDDEPTPGMAEQEQASGGQAYYTELGVVKEADVNAIKNAFKKLSMKYHPDKRPCDKLAAKKMRKINKAYEVLNNTTKRKAYDSYGEIGVDIVDKMGEEQYEHFEKYKCCYFGLICLAGLVFVGTGCCLCCCCCCCCQLGRLGVYEEDPNGDDSHQYDQEGSEDEKEPLNGDRSKSDGKGSYTTTAPGQNVD